MGGADLHLTAGSATLFMKCPHFLLTLAALGNMGVCSQARAEDLAVQGKGPQLVPQTVGVRVGLGRAYGVQGLQAGALWRLHRVLRAGVFVGFGGLLGTGQQQNEFLWAAGLQLRWGVEHRLILDVNYEAVDTQEYSLHGISISRVGVYGMATRLGYEYQEDSGLHLQLSIGPSLNLDTGRLEAMGSGVLAVGFRFGVNQ